MIFTFLVFLAESLKKGERATLINMEKILENWIKTGELVTRRPQFPKFKSKALSTDMLKRLRQLSSNSAAFEKINVFVVWHMVILGNEI